MNRVRTVLTCLTAIVIFSAGPGTTSPYASPIATDTETPALTAQYDWPNGTAVPWTLSYDAKTNLVTFTVDNTTLQYITPLNGFTDVLVRARAVNDGSEMMVDNLVLDGTAVGDGLDILWISRRIFADGFVLTGQTTMSWTGDHPNQSRLAFQIKIDTLATVYVEKATWGQLKSLFNK